MLLDDRFWSKVNKNGAIHPTLKTRCWEWTGSIVDGYGTFWFEGKPLYAHRLSWAFSNGPIPAGLLTLHHCDNRSCIRPKHLYIGTNQDNTKDKLSRGREARGITHGRLKIVAADVLLIRQAHGTLREIAARFGVSISHVYNIRSGKRRAA